MPATMRAHARRRIRHLAGLLRRDQSGATIIEFAFTLPLFMIIGFYGLETTYMSSVNTQVSQMALGVADNASRLGQTDNSAVAPTVQEVDIDAVLYGALQQGKNIDFENNGKIILTSFERDTASGKQYIHWQRCAGKLARSSAYGNDTTKNGLSGTPFTGIGKPGHMVSVPVTAAGGQPQAIMFVEVYYQYQPLMPALYVKSTDVEFRQEQAVLVRDDRNLNGLSGTKKSTC